MHASKTLTVLAVALVVLAVAAKGEEKVLTLDVNNFDKALEDHEFIVVEFYAPWCGHCKNLAPEYEQAAKTLEGDMSAGKAITLAKVDASDDPNRPLAERFGVGGFPTLKIFADHSKTPTDYEGPRDAAGIVSYLKKRAGPASRELSDAGAAKKLKEEEPVLVVLADKESATWTAVANSLRDSATWVHTSDKSVMKALGVKAGAITMLRSFDVPSVYSGAATDEAAIMEWANAERVEVGLFIMKGDQEAIKVVFEDESKPNVFLFTDDKKTAVDDFKAAATGVKGKMISAYFVSTDFPEAFSHFGMDKFMENGDLPKVLIEDRASGDRYLMEDAAVNKKTLSAFLSAYQEGKLEQFLKSEPEPADNNGPVKVIVGDTFQEQVNNAGKWVFLEAYAPWCGHCKKLTPIWEDVGRAMEGSSKIVIAKCDATANDLPKSLGIKGFPTLLLFKGDGSEPERYQGDRSFDQLTAFIEGKTGAKVPQGFVPLAPPPAKGGPSIDKQIIKFLSTEFQIPVLGDGVTVSGLYIAAIVVFLLFVASVALVIACLAKDPPPPEPKTTKKEAGEKKEAAETKKEM